MIDPEYMRALHPTPLETPEVGVPRPFAQDFSGKARFSNSLDAAFHLSRESRIIA
jgi:hypothetical protein